MTDKIDPDAEAREPGNTNDPQQASSDETMSQAVTIMPPAIAEALSKLQGEVDTITKSAKNEHFGNTYAELKDVQEKALPLLSKHGLALTQWPISRNGTFYLRSYLVHTSGVGIVDDIELMLTKRDAQGLGSSLTYTRRQTTMAYLGLSAEDDDDGNKAAGRQARPTDDQISEIRQLCIDLKFPPDQIEVRVGSLRTEDHATVAIANLRKMISERAKQVRGDSTAIPVFTGDRDQVVPKAVIEAAKGNDDIVTNIQKHILALPIKDDKKRGLVHHVTGKPFLKNCTSDELTEVAEVVEAIQDGTYKMPADWTEQDIAPPEEVA